MDTGLTSAEKLLQSTAPLRSAKIPRQVDDQSAWSVALATSILLALPVTLGVRRARSLVLRPHRRWGTCFWAPLAARLFLLFFFGLGFFSFLFFLSLAGAGAGAGVGAGAGAGVSRGGDASSRSLRALHARARRPLSRQLWPSAANCHWRQVRFQNSCWALEPAERFTRLQQ